TSVEHIRPAGFWVRSMAAMVDLMLCGIFVGVIVALAALTALAAGQSKHSSGVFNDLALAAYGLGLIALLARNGRTLGQSLFELEVVDIATGDRPRWGSAAIRVVLLGAIPFVFTVTNRILGQFGYKLNDVADALVILSALAPVILLLWASLRSLGKQTIWDRLSGTMVRYR